MDTAPLKSFATWARTALIREVTARIAITLAPASPQRVEQPKAVAALEEAIAAAGGGEKGRGAVADRVAYTWFNRIIALRFMDANGYTGIGVVSPQAGVDVGQPEILAEAKRANIDRDVVSQTIRESVSGLLNGTRRSDDPQGEAYALLLTEYCRHWNRSMPFMFERQGDFTELLMPASLLADNSVLSRAVRVLTEDVCRDVEVIGWLYQFYISERKDEVFASFKKKKKAGAGEIPAATQLFTPHWIVRFLVENSLGRLWMLNRPESRLVLRMDYYIPPVDPEADFLKVNSPQEMKVLDPACGSGHILSYAFDLLFSIYEEEGFAPADIPGLILSNNLYGTEIDPRAGSLAAFSLTMKARARQRSFFSASIDPHICVLEPVEFTTDELDLLASHGGGTQDESLLWNQFQNADILGSLVHPIGDSISRMGKCVAELQNSAEDLFTSSVVDKAMCALRQATYLSRDYRVVVANPPYMGSANMNAQLREWAESAEPTGKADLFSLFILRCIALVQPGGLVAMVTMQSWMFLKSFVALRDYVLASAPIRVLAHLGARAFDSIPGERVKTVAFVLQQGGDTRDRGAFVRIVDAENETSKAEALRQAAAHSGLRFELASSALRLVPESPIAYWASDAVVQLFVGPKFAKYFAARIGIQSGNNAHHYRRWPEVSWRRIRRDIESWEEFAVDRGAVWVPLEAGGDRRKWYGNTLQVARLGIEGCAITETPNGSLRNNLDYFKPAVVWNRLNEGRMGFRLVPSGHVFDDLSPFCQANNGADLHTALAILGSDLGRELLGIVGSGSKTEVGHVNRLPYPRNDAALAEAAECAGFLVGLSRSDWDAGELSIEFTKPLLPRGDSQDALLSDIAQSALAGIRDRTVRVIELQRQLDAALARAFGLETEIRPTDATLLFDDTTSVKDLCIDLASYSVGCMFGRYSLDEPGLVIADQGATIQDYLTKVPSPTFAPDVDNVIPIVDGDWFEDDIVTRFRHFVRVAFGKKHFEENLRFVTESLGVKDLRDYFVKSFYKDHVQRYKKRPIYWLFSSPKGSFNALIYLHRYMPSTVSTVLNEYLREFKAKLEATLGQQERLAAGGGTPRQQAAAQKEADRIRKMLLELDEYEHDVLYPLAAQQIEIDLDDGVRVNYPKFGAALKKIPGLEAEE
jgi:hypothetical protein